MKPGDMIRIPMGEKGGYRVEEVVGIILSSRPTRWDSRVLFYEILTLKGVVEDVPHFHWHQWEVLIEHSGR